MKLQAGFRRHASVMALWGHAVTGQFGCFAA
jgi:hypothetical protein